MDFVSINASSLSYNIKKVWNPEFFQGNGKTKNYFEGWYFKLVSNDGKDKLAFIPGIAFGNKAEEAHAFIQMIDGTNAKTEYFSFKIEDFTYSQRDFAIRIKDNFFSAAGMELHLQNEENTIRGKLEFSGMQRLPGSFFSPGIMGWYQFVPLMECYHGVVSLTHRVSGSISLNNRAINFNEGLGYTEKDWGRSFPSSWIWMQSNHFGKENTSFFFSLAKIPWFLSSFVGFLCVLMVDGKITRFATYTGAKIKAVELSGDKVQITIKDRARILKISATRADFVVLKAPANGMMERRISESMNAVLHISLSDKHHARLFEGTATNAGLDIVGDVSELMP